MICDVLISSRIACTCGFFGHRRKVKTELVGGGESKVITRFFANSSFSGSIILVAWRAVDVVNAVSLASAEAIIAGELGAIAA